MNTIKPLVSVCCITYNQEAFIGQAIESFLMQKTSFPFEIIIHDDASTDGTTEIIRQYSQKYPELIVPVFQTINQFSRGYEIFATFVWPKARGTYIAMCEGDDYWIDPEKLQKQIEAMGRFPCIDISFHPAFVRYENTHKNDTRSCNYDVREKIFSLEEVIMGGGGFMPTASIVLKKSATGKIETFFSSIEDVPIGDVFIQILGAESAGALYLPDVMSVYRRNVVGSWSHRVANCTVEKDNWALTHVKLHEKLDDFTGKKYSDIFIKKLKKNIPYMLRQVTIKNDVKKKLYALYGSKIPIIERVKWHIIFKHVTIYKIARIIRKKLLYFFSVK